MCEAHSFERVSANRRAGPIAGPLPRSGAYAVPIGGLGDASGTRPPGRNDIILNFLNPYMDFCFSFAVSPRRGETHGRGFKYVVLTFFLLPI